MVNGDGDMDCVALNTGWNTKYRRPSVAKPTLLYYGAMEDDAGQSHLIEVKSDTSHGLLPVRGLSCSSGAMPFLKSKFSTYHDFASSTLDDIYDPARLAEATRLAANELASGVLINNGDGTFRWQPLPDLAQVAPGYGATLSDLNGDGNVDIYFVQNLLTREPETGAWSGGISCMLHGDGTGSFDVAAWDETGLTVAGDAKGMAITDADHDGRPDIVVARNNDTLQFFRQRNSDASGAMAIRLRGPIGNPTAVGARVTLTGEGHSTQTAEVYAGTGYLSQSSPYLFFATADPDLPARLEIRWPNGKITNHTVNWTRMAVVEYGG